MKLRQPKHRYKARTATLKAWDVFLGAFCTITVVSAVGLCLRFTGLI